MVRSPTLYSQYDNYVRIYFCIVQYKKKSWAFSAQINKPGNLSGIPGLTGPGFNRSCLSS
jgi:hypothetical protein